MTIKNIKKRDGAVVNFDKEKITDAVYRAAEAVGGNNRTEAERVTDLIVKYLEQQFSEENVPSVEDVQDYVEKALIELGHAQTAKAYILYRHEKALERETKKMMGIHDDLKMPLNSLQVLEKRYLLRDEMGKIIETPSALFHRVAKHLASNEKNYGADDKIVKHYEDAFYQMMTNFEFLPNSPTLMNAGTSSGQLAACFILPVKDDIEAIFEAVKWQAMVHKTGGGTGFCFSYLRPKGDFVRSTTGIASGPMSFMSAFDNATSVVKQGGKRRGANMATMHVWHPDIQDFITMKQTAGVMENFNVSVMADDKFMEAIEKNEEYELLNPRTKQSVRKINARSLFEMIAYSAWRSAEPGLLFIDQINRNNPTPIDPIHATNPCIAKDSIITTNEGLLEMENVHNPLHVLGDDGEYHRITWHGQTGEKEVFLVKTNAGYELKATVNHKFLTENGWMEVSALDSRDKLVLQKEGKFGILHIDKELALMLGWIVRDGHMSNGTQDIIFYFGSDENEKQELLPLFKKYLNNLNGNEVLLQENETEIRIKYSSKIAKIFYDLGVRPVKADEKEVPSKVFQMDRESISAFLSALFAADGSVQGSKKKGVSIRLASNSIKLLKQVQILLLQFGIVSKIYAERREAHTKIMPDSNRKPKEYGCRSQHELIISKASMFEFMNKISFAIKSKNKKFESLKPQKIYSDDIDTSIHSIEKCGVEKVYDLTEPVTHSFSANGLIVHNCGEVPMPDFESCNLGSINLVKFVDLDWSKIDWKKKIKWDRLRYVIRLSFQLLDNVIDLNVYPISQIREQTLKNRRIGLGVMGFGRMLYMIGVCYDSELGYEVGKEIMKFINDEARKMSHELGRVRGSFPGFKDSLLSRKYDAVRNATCTSIAPTGTISMIADTSSGIEPVFALSFLKTVRAGQYYYLDSTFEHVLKVRGLYSDDLIRRVMEEGTIQQIGEIPADIKEVFRVAHDISPEAHVRMQAAFQQHVDLAVSKTINMSANSTVEDVKNVYLLAWKLGCKGITIYRDSSRQEQVLHIGKSTKTKGVEEEGYEVLMAEAKTN